MELISNIEGADATAQISRLHGTDIELVSSYIAEYVHSNERSIIWVGSTESSEAGAELTRRMIQAIEKGGPVFSNLQHLTIAGHEVFQVNGPGGEHFFYNSREAEEDIVWLTIESADALAIFVFSSKDVCCFK